MSLILNVAIIGKQKCNAQIIHRTAPTTSTLPQNEKIVNGQTIIEFLKIYHHNSVSNSVNISVLAVNNSNQQQNIWLRLIVASSLATWLDKSSIEPAARIVRELVMHHYKSPSMPRLNPPLYLYLRRNGAIACGWTDLHCNSNAFRALNQRDQSIYMWVWTQKCVHQVSKTGSMWSNRDLIYRALIIPFIIWPPQL